MARRQTDLPLSCPLSTPNTAGEFSNVHQISDGHLLIDGNDGASPSNLGVQYDVDMQERHRNVSTLESASRVKFVDGDPASKQPTTAAELEPDRLDHLDSLQLPRKPAPAANIPVIQGTRVGAPPQGLLVEDQSTRASVDVTGLKISSRSSPHISAEWKHQIHRDATTKLNGKGSSRCYARQRAKRLISLLRRPHKSSKSNNRANLATAFTSPSSKTLVSLEAGNESSVISDYEHRLNCDNSSVASLTLADDREQRQQDGRYSMRTSEASTNVCSMFSQDFNPFASGHGSASPDPLSGQVSPTLGRDSESSFERPRQYRHGILSSILKLYGHNRSSSSSSRELIGGSRNSSVSDGSSADDSSARGCSPDSAWKPQRPKKWYEKSASRSSGSFSGSSSKLPSPLNLLRRTRSSGATTSGSGSRRWVKSKLEDEIRITIHIAELLSRQRYLVKLCRALMKYGAPTHRLEESMRMTARVLEIDAQFLYIPDCMIISFDDASTHTTEVKVVRSTQGIDLGRLADVHEIYKEVIHDVIGVEEAIQRLDETMKRHNKFHTLFLIFIHGCASASVGPFAFGARPIDMPIAFVLGCLLGVLQLILYPKSSLYSNVFEISAAVLTSFLARAFGSIRYQGEPFFCFSALAQSSIALILPGYTVLCASLELQSRNLVAGSVRMVYAIIYSLFLGFGVTIGTAVYGLLDSEATTEYTCPPSPITNEYLQRFPFVLCFTICLALVNHAKWRQLPVMMVISLSGYIVSYFSSKRFISNTQVSNALGAFVIGVLGNVYSRVRHGLAAAAMLPAIFVLVPSGLAASGSLISGITAAEGMTGAPYGVIANGTQGFMDAAKNMTTIQTRNQNYGVAFDIGYGMIQVAIGTSVGLFLAALMVYPLGKKRSGLFSF
ncbi:putative UPF0442 protein [Penicillium oxalicum]|uniref:Threonine/serine exporter-like N-terminal domain-containing protein n=1 Tax=Penicillium oxalicum (strain 114-2 / CGMCC 5302) TaxID=933388 RepID=S8AYN7_PENO1|nr:putative UPF0442 protein [Penicillium oxalicum]EPS27097.1 hypothetical protein PDE_02038 [Penicillium oxalicum 114-2]KAI2786223.1 putative UPF0442 protein [Penicillium oxalicum]